MNTRWFKGKREFEQEMNEELQFHIEKQIRANIAAGMHPDEARRQAKAQLGAVEGVKENCRDERSGSWLESLWTDVRYAGRVLRKSPGFTAIVVITLALGIGASTAIFSIVNAVLLRAPFKDSSQLVLLHEGLPKMGFSRMSFSPPDFALFAREQKAFSVLGTFLNEHMDISGGGEPDRILVSRVSATLFPMLGIEPALGRNFSPQEDAPGHPVGILSYSLWQRRYGGKANIVGQQIDLDRQPYVVIGIMPRGFEFPLPGAEDNGSPADLWVPMAVTPGELQNWGGLYLTSVVGRLRPGVTLDQARAEVAALAPGILASYPAVIRNAIGQAKLDITAFPFHHEIVGSVSTLLLVLMAAVSCILLIACANVATLLLSRSGTRQREIAIRTTLGATRSRLVRQLLTESVLLATSGGALGFVLAIWLKTVLLAFVPSSIPLPLNIPISGGVLAFALCVSLFAAVFVGLAPTLHVSSHATRTPLHDGGRGMTASRARRRTQGVFVTAEFALALVLLIAAGLLIRSFARLVETSPGFRDDHLLTLNIPLPRHAYSHASQLREFYQQLLDRVSNLPGVRNATVSSDLPLHMTEMVSFGVKGRSSVEGKGPQAICQTWVVGNYFQTMGIPLIEGRWFTPGDRSGSQQVAIVSAHTAKTFWPGQDAIGKNIRWGGGPWDTVVGVVGDVKQGPLDRPLDPHVYRPYNQAADGLLEDDPFNDWHAMNLVLRTQTDPLSTASAAVAEIHSLDPDLAVANIQTMEQVIRSSVAGSKFNTFLLGAFAGVALFLAAIGIYGVLAYNVSQQSREIGIRMALGAQRSSVMRLVLRQGTRFALIGCGIGVAAALALTRLMRSLLYNTSPADPTTFAGVVIVLVVVAFVACWIPARRAMRVDPVVALRHE